MHTRGIFPLEATRLIADAWNVLDAWYASHLSEAALQWLVDKPSRACSPTPATAATMRPPIVFVIQMLEELGQIVALEGAFRDIVPNRLGIFMRYLVIRGPQGKNQVIRGALIFRLVDVQAKTP